MKKIDRLLFRSFLGPFVVAFGIALFVLVMQFLWLYIDEIAGKGVSVLVLFELIGYLSISTFPMALPIAVLISSVMVMGNLAERYELSSMKSAGVSLLRVMRALIFCAAGIALFSYACSDFLIPISNLKFKSRLYDIRRAKPALTLEKGVFNEDFRQFVIRIGDKEKDGETIKDVLIEDQSNVQKVKFSQILADSGQMFTSRDGRYFVMHLFEGNQYQEPQTQAGTGSRQKYPFIRTHFESWTKVWDMKEFELNATDEDRFKTQRAMLSMKQLRQNVDSLKRGMDETRQFLANDLMNNLKRQPTKPVQTTPQKDTSSTKSDRIAGRLNPRTEQQKIAGSALPLPDPYARLPKQELGKPLAQYGSFDETFREADRPALIREAHARAGTLKTSLDTRKSQIESRRKEAAKTGYELYTKYSFALVCFIFLFIGAPMGAIIRKGGFGYPILVSIIFFVLFIMLTILCRKLSDRFVLTPFWAAMVPCLLLAPLAAFLTRKGMNDSQMFNTDRFDRFVYRLRSRFSRQQNTSVPS
ncbi:MAG: LptF/LptG family permease [Saprospiraceae bacterium]|nr:LptF/LptG family permease [Saprospiraceae bacterium]